MMRVIFILFILGFGYSGNLAAKEVPVSENAKYQLEKDQRYFVVAVYLKGNPKQNAILATRVINREIKKLGDGWVYDSYIEQSKMARLFVFKKNN